MNEIYLVVGDGYDDYHGHLSVLSWSDDLELAQHEVNRLEFEQVTCHCGHRHHYGVMSVGKLQNLVSGPCPECGHTVVFTHKEQPAHVQCGACGLTRLEVDWPKISEKENFGSGSSRKRIKIHKSKPLHVWDWELECSVQDKDGRYTYNLGQNRSRMFLVSSELYSGERLKDALTDGRQLLVETHITSLGGVTYTVIDKVLGSSPSDAVTVPPALEKEFPWGDEDRWAWKKRQQKTEGEPVTDVKIRVWQLYSLLTDFDPDAEVHVHAEGAYSSCSGIGMDEKGNLCVCADESDLEGLERKEVKDG